MGDYKCGTCGGKLLRLADDCPYCMMKEIEKKEANEAAAERAKK